MVTPTSKWPRNRQRIRWSIYISDLASSRLVWSQQKYLTLLKTGSRKIKQSKECITSPESPATLSRVKRYEKLNYNKQPFVKVK